MKAIIVAAPGDIRMVDTEKPAVGPGDVLIRVAYSGICGTDLAILSGETSLVRSGLIKYPVRIGHEWSGIVETVGSNVNAFKPGDRVVSDSGVVCGQCINCMAGMFDRCLHPRSIGTINCWDGSFAEYMLLPERHLYKLPDQINLEEAALIEPASIALSGIKQSMITMEQVVLVIGTGAIGLSTVALLKSIGVSSVLLSGRKQFKLDIGKTMGADKTVNITKENLLQFVMENTGGKGVDLVLETSGNIETVSQCVEVCKPGGKIALIGFYETDLNQFDIDQFVFKQLGIKGILGMTGAVGEIISIMASGKLNLKPLITHRFGFNQVIEAIRTADDKNDTKVKMMVEFGVIPEE